jgi:hypothetical protein
MCWNKHEHHGSANGHCMFYVDAESNWTAQVKHESTAGVMWCEPVCIDFE